jgi:RNA polymerase sigma factor (sigma-70 family)
MTVLVGYAQASDAVLISAVRGGSADAYSHLYTRHVGAARSLARRLCTSPTAADDAVSEAFARMLQVLRAGGGPDEAFRAYLLRSLRNNVYDRYRKEKWLRLTDDMEPHATTEEFTDVAVETVVHDLASRAFRKLPQRWQAVLWHTTVEEQPPAKVAAILGTSANNVTSLAYRAREGLRLAYLECYVADVEPGPCAQALQQYAAGLRSRVDAEQERAVTAHLAGCDRCRQAVEELEGVHRAMPAGAGRRSARPPA